MAGRVQIDVDVDVDELVDQFDGIVNDWASHREAVQIAIAERLVGGLKREINVNTGRAQDTIRAIEGSGETVEVVAGGESGVDYILPLLEGSEPHAPGPSDPASNPSLERWASRNGYPGGFDGIYWSIAKYGTEPHDFVTEPLEATDNEAGEIAQQVLDARGAFDE